MVRPFELPLPSLQEGDPVMAQAPYPAWQGRVLCAGSAFLQYISVV